MCGIFYRLQMQKASMFAEEPHQNDSLIFLVGQQSERCRRHEGHVMKHAKSKCLKYHCGRCDASVTSRVKGPLQSKRFVGMRVDDV